MFEKDKLPILGILRGITEISVKPLALTCINSGLKYIEITMNTKGAEDLIRQMITVSDNKLFVGAGTVLNLEDLNRALAAGAKFIVCPTIVEEVILECNEQHIPVFPGALTPTEVQKAWSLGATMVKLFPASFFGPAYIRELKAPLNSIKIMAVGGVNENNINVYFSEGADAVAFGSSIFKQQWIDEGRFDLIEEKIGALIKQFKLTHIS
jgi:2-dehydro-3-deoxyphosphogluconate aldolase / (4S)-4-hydroxy-2-oxoglutarate aldolase